MLPPDRCAAVTMVALADGLMRFFRVGGSTPPINGASFVENALRSRQQNRDRSTRQRLVRPERAHPEARASLLSTALKALLGYTAAGE